jgi:hypothetical protein
VKSVVIGQRQTAGLTGDVPAILADVCPSCPVKKCQQSAAGATRLMLAMMQERWL